MVRAEKLKFWVLKSGRLRLIFRKEIWVFLDILLDNELKVSEIGLNAEIVGFGSDW